MSAKSKQTQRDYRTIARLAEHAADRVQQITHLWCDGCIYDEHHPGTLGFSGISVLDLAKLDASCARQALRTAMDNLVSGDACVIGKWMARSDNHQAAIREINQTAAQGLYALSERYRRHADGPSTNTTSEEIQAKAAELVRLGNRYKSKNEFARSIGCSPNARGFRRYVESVGWQNIRSTTDNRQVRYVDGSIGEESRDTLELLIAEEELQNQLKKVRDKIGS